jgi:hemerythrin superfamily protein
MELPAQWMLEAHSMPNNEERIMPTASRGSTGQSKRQAKPGRAQQDAISLLKADHRQVEEWFEQFEKSRSEDKKADLAKRICDALRIHTTIEEEIFYPAFLEASGETDIHHEAEIEHAGAKNLISQIEASGSDEYFDARVKVLSEMIKHHVKEEEQRGGMFSKAKESGMDLKLLGEQMLERKTSLEQGGKGRPN